MGTRPNGTSDSTYWMHGRRPPALPEPPAHNVLQFDEGCRRPLFLQHKQRLTGQHPPLRPPFEPVVQHCRIPLLRRTEWQLEII